MLHRVGAKPTDSAFSLHYVTFVFLLFCMCPYDPLFLVALSNIVIYVCLHANRKNAGLFLYYVRLVTDAGGGGAVKKLT